jgi:hypothetical protein
LPNQCLFAPDRGPQRPGRRAGRSSGRSATSHCVISKLQQPILLPARSLQHATATVASVRCWSLCQDDAANPACAQAYRIAIPSRAESRAEMARCERRNRVFATRLIHFRVALDAAAGVAVESTAEAAATGILSTARRTSAGRVAPSSRAHWPGR